MGMLSLIANLSFIVCNFWDIYTQKSEKRIAKILLEKGLNLSLAESCTGGLISSRMTDVSGSSAYISQNYVTYANEAKIKILRVNSQTIEMYGVVSSEVALEMAKGLLKESNSSVALSITGIAGPLGGSTGKPVGLAYVGIVSGRGEKVYKINVNSKLDRRLIKYAFSNRALEFLIQFLKENY